MMRVNMLVWLAMFGVASNAAAAGVRHGRVVRAVQVINLMARVTEPSEGAGDPDVSAHDQGAGAGSPDTPFERRVDFKIHELNRHPVQIETVQTSPLAYRTLSSGDVDQDPFVPVGVAQPDVPAYDGTVAPWSSIAVPDWMRSRLAAQAVASMFNPGCAPSAYRPSGLLRASEEINRQAYFSIMSDIACQHGIPVGLFDAVIIRESRYDPMISSPRNAFGLTQLMPGTAANLGVNRYDIRQNLRGGARYLREQLDRFGQYRLALAAYNAGPGRVRNGSAARIAETRDYVANIMRNWSRLDKVAPASSVLAPPVQRRPVTARSVRGSPLKLPREEEFRIAVRPRV